MLNAFAIGIGRVKGRSWIVLLFLLANLLPQEALLYPLYYMFKSVGLYDNVWSVIIVFTVIQAAFGTYLLSSVYGTFPKEILEAAAIDGASRWQILWRVVFPISRPTLSVLLIFFFIWTWNEFLIPLTFLASNANQTVPVAISVLQGDRLMDVTTTSASALARHHPDAHLLPHLPAHAHPGHHGRSSQVMKFTDGFWQLRPGRHRAVRAGGVRHLGDGCRRRRLRPGHHRAHQGDRLARRRAQPARCSPMTLSSPLEGVVRVRIAHHTGGAPHGGFELPGAVEGGAAVGIRLAPMAACSRPGR